MFVKLSHEYAYSSVGEIVCVLSTVEFVVGSIPLAIALSAMVSGEDGDEEEEEEVLLVAADEAAWEDEEAELLACDDVAPDGAVEEEAVKTDADELEEEVEVPPAAVDSDERVFVRVGGAATNRAPKNAYAATPANMTIATTRITTTAPLPIPRFAFKPVATGRVN